MKEDTHIRQDQPSDAGQAGYTPKTPGDWTGPEPLNVQEALDTLGAGAPATDVNAIHDNVAAEISAITEKATPVSADVVVIEDSAASDVKKRVQLGNLGLAHTIASHSDTTATGAELETLTGGIDSDSLHTHPSIEAFAVAMAVAL